MKWQKYVCPKIFDKAVNRNKNKIMKKNYLAAILFLFYMGDAAALPDCPSSGYFDNCYGAYEWDNGDKYVGEWKDDKKNGQGTYSYANGDQYVGENKDGKAHGEGTYIFGRESQWAGDKYVGMYKDGNIHGQGTYTFASGEKYVGEFKDGIRDGQGTNTYTSGDKYVGEYKDGSRHGQGTYTYASGTTERGYFSNNEFVPDICEDMGLKKGSAEFGQCVLKLMDD